MSVDGDLYKVEGKIVDEDGFATLLAHYQQQLSLSDWKITAKIMRGSRMENGTQACVWSNHELRLAEISVIDPEDYEDDLGGDQDMEVSLVHELVHLVFWFLPEIDQAQSPLRYTLEEQAVEAVAQALVTGRRQVMKNKTKKCS